MDDPGGVRLRKRVRRLRGLAEERLQLARRTLFDARVQRLAVDVLHGDEVRRRPLHLGHAGLVDHDDVRVVEP